ncbi:iron complex transport system ATP-binding protein [Georgenia satyanarayanai]|uniref:Iron complex transport system ATP-binding protein n=1 Tax=Georgenia satyanarayanai TaxID=860221 RepID=A0A2Y9C494_9MICO|nr:heme ABC transporter ATP-binding protein [Georgenia satyanarayanai]PYG00984.1 iron complex transport system ATP-binding protein [Georgenia satyanarayanai]SSA39223.1 iron complex transport system ATP-binding protein [Georgenia satyanarayanai]
MRLLPRRPRLPQPLERGEVALAVDGARVALGGATILDDVSLSVRAGEVVALVGPNGAGKSTLLGVLSGDVAAGGTVTLAGRPLDRWTTTEAAMRRAVLVQRGTLSFPFTCRQVVEMGRAPWSRTPREDDDAATVAHAMGLTETTALAHRTFSSLSGGEQARVSLARVLAQSAGVVLLDEPTAALDLHHQELVLRLARDRAAAGDAVVVVLHDLNLAAGYADRVAVLDRGRVAAVGAPGEVLQPELLSSVYQHAVEVLPHPRTAAPIILARR